MKNTSHMGPDLKTLQTLLYSAITARPWIARSSRAAALSSMIRGDGRLPMPARLNIYADAYFYRLLDCLREDFTATAAVTGSAFKGLVRAYLGKYPPTEPSIFYAGRFLPEFLANHPRCEHWPFVSELARLERTLIEVFHDADASIMRASEIGEIAPAAWPGLRLRLHPALRMFNCNWRVNDVLRAVTSATAWQRPARTPVILLVWRQDGRVYYRELEPAEGAALEAVSREQRFAAVCEAFAARFDGEDAASVINEMLVRWIADGLLARPFSNQ
jgi:putative DNA-binding protein